MSVHVSNRAADFITWLQVSYHELMQVRMLSGDEDCERLCNAMRLKQTLRSGYEEELLMKKKSFITEVISGTMARNMTDSDVVCWPHIPF